MHDPIIRHSYVQINGSLVHLLQYGFGESLIKSPSTNRNSSLTIKSLSSNNSLGKNYNNTTSEQERKLIIFVPGNPGVLGIYHDFLISLFRVINNSSNKDSHNQPTILAIGHNNFDHPDHVQYRAEERICIEENDMNFVEGALAKKHYDEPHHIELQVLNKLIILKRLLKINIEDCRIVFIGHSVGCYVILRLLQDKLIASAHEGSVLIHPALENIALTEKGSVYDRLFSYKFDLVLKSVAFVLDNLLPNPAKLALTRWFCSAEFVQNSSEIALESVAQLVCQKTFNAIIQMAKSEFATVKDINVDSMIKPHISRLKLIYAINDHWVNTDNRRILRELYPDLYMEEQSTLHAFVMDPHTVMDYAVKIGMFIQDFIDSIDQDETGYGSNINYIKV